MSPNEIINKIKSYKDFDEKFADKLLQYVCSVDREIKNSGKPM